MSELRVCFQVPARTMWPSVPPHVQPLLEQARQVCETDDQFAKLAVLLTAYQDVFSKGDDDVGRTDMGEHSIPLLDGTRPIRQPPR